MRGAAGPVSRMERPSRRNRYTLSDRSSWISKHLGGAEELWQVAKWLLCKFDYHLVSCRVWSWQTSSRVVFRVPDDGVTQPYHISIGSESTFIESIIYVSKRERVLTFGLDALRKFDCHDQAHEAQNVRGR